MGRGRAAAGGRGARAPDRLTKVGVGRLARRPRASGTDQPIVEASAAGKSRGGAAAIAEPAVALTDALIAIESTAFAVQLLRGPRVRGVLRAPFIVFFGATAAAAFSGAVLHGMTVGRSDGRRRALWRLSMASIGVAALSSWSLATRLAMPGRHGAAERIATWAHAPYLILVTTHDVPYRVAVIWYLPAAVVLGAVLASRIGNPADGPPARLAIAGLGVTFVAAGVQVRRIGLGPRFDHNALYHTLQAVGIAVLYRSAVRFFARGS